MQWAQWMLESNTSTDWLTALAVAGAVFFGLRLVKAVLVRRLRRLAERTANGIDDVGAGILARTKTFFLILVALWAGTLSVRLPPPLGIMVETMFVLGLLVQAALWGTAAVDMLLRRHAQRRLEEEDAATATTVKFVGFVVRLALWVLVALVALDNLGVDITAMVAGLGVGGIAVALAVQNILGDLFASLSIVLDKPFVIGDFVIIDDLLGTIEHVGLKTTRVRSLSGEQIIFSNNDLLSSRIRNYKRMFERRVAFRIGVTYGTPYETLAAIPGMIRDAVEAQDKTRFDRAHFASYGDFSLDFEIVYYVLDPDYNRYMDIQQAINMELYRRFEEDGIEFAFPTQTLHVQRSPADRHGAAASEGRDAVPAGGD